MYEQNTSMMNIPEQNAFLLPAMVEGDFSSEEIAEDADGLQMMSFQRVKIPAGGALQFEIPTEDPDNPDYARTLEGVVLYNHSAYTLWPEGSEYDEDTKPLCSSVDGKTGIGEPGGACATCPMNAYGSARHARTCGTFTCCAAASICLCRSLCRPPALSRSRNS